MDVVVLRPGSANVSADLLPPSLNCNRPCRPALLLEGGVGAVHPSFTDGSNASDACFWLRNYSLPNFVVVGTILCLYFKIELKSVSVTRKPLLGKSKHWNRYSSMI